MLKIDYKLVYEIAPWADQVRMRRRQVEDAEAALREAEETYKEKCAKLSGTKLYDLQFSNVMCMARSITGGHVYHIKHSKSVAPHGHHENKCIFCGCDNVEDLY